MKRNTNSNKARLIHFQEMMQKFSQIIDRSNFFRQRCTGLGRMECQTLRLLDSFKEKKALIRERIKSTTLTPEEIKLYIPRALRVKYQAGELGDLLDSLPRDISMKSLAGEVEVACSRMTRIGDTLSDEMDPNTGKMRGKGMIHREASPDDRRVILIGITELGSQKVCEQSDSGLKIAQEILDDIPPAKIPIVEEGLQIYLSLLEKHLPAYSSENTSVSNSDS
jgi:DNA-binding MarR family transcriptional regulator